MAPKRSASKGKVEDVAVGEGEVHGWKSSKCSDSHLLNLLEKHLLQPRSVIVGVDLRGNLFPMRKGTNMLFSFLMFFGASVFLFLISSGASFSIRGVQVHHLTPNSIFHISIFVHLCEAFLGIEPHFDLF